MIDRRRILLTKERRRLPAEYQEVEWICLDTASWIDLLLVPFNDPSTEKSTYYKLKYKTNTYHPYVLYAYTSASSQFIIDPVGLVSYGIRIYHNGGNYYFRSNITDMGLNKVQTLELVDTAIYFNDVFTEKIERICTPTATNKINKNSSASLTVMELQQDDHIFIPCYRKGDVTIGLYDIKSGSFLVNSGTGIITKGEDI